MKLDRTVPAAVILLLLALAVMGQATRQSVYFYAAVCMIVCSFAAALLVGFACVRLGQISKGQY